jgi:tRNA G18 (ribose-2'-O)-methylase SpoU
VIVELDDITDPRLVDYASLNVVETRRDVERRGSFFIAESELVIRELVALRDRWPIRSVLVTPKRFEAMADVLDPAAACGVPIFVAPMELVREITGFHIHRGAVASAERGEPATTDQVARDAARVVVLEGVNDHENLGSIFRSASAFGFDAVLLDPRCADPLYRRCVRVSMGQVLRIPFARFGGWEEVRSLGLTIWALTPAIDARGITELTPAVNDRIGLLLGAEGSGLTATAMSAADTNVRIPMADAVDSLNVAVAGAIAMQRLFRPVATP